MCVLTNKNNNDGNACNDDDDSLLTGAIHCIFSLFFVALESMSNSKAINEFTIRCGRCDKLKIVPTDRTPQAKAQYFKKSE